MAGWKLVPEIQHEVQQQNIWYRRVFRVNVVQWEMNSSASRIWKLNLFSWWATLRGTGTNTSLAQGFSIVFAKIVALTQEPKCGSCIPAAYPRQKYIIIIIKLANQHNCCDKLNKYSPFAPGRLINFVSARDCCYLLSDKRPEIVWVAPITGDFKCRRKNLYLGQRSWFEFFQLLDWGFSASA